MTYLEPDTLLFPLVGSAFVVLGVAGTVRPRSWMVVTALLLTMPAYVQSVRVLDYADHAERPGIYHCDEPELESCIAFFAPAVREFRADVLRRPEAREPGYEGPTRYEYSVDPLGGWLLVAWTVLAISLVVWFRAILLAVPRPWLAVLVFLAVLLVIAFYTVALVVAQPRVADARASRSPAMPGVAPRCSRPAGARWHSRPKSVLGHDCGALCLRTRRPRFAANRSAAANAPGGIRTPDPRLRRPPLFL